MRCRQDALSPPGAVPEATGWPQMINPGNHPDKESDGERRPGRAQVHTRSPHDGHEMTAMRD
jgi:hypothetical protein